MSRATGRRAHVLLPRGRLRDSVTFGPWDLTEGAQVCVRADVRPPTASPEEKTGGGQGQRFDPSLDGAFLLEVLLWALQGQTCAGAVSVQHDVAVLGGHYNQGIFHCQGGATGLTYRFATAAFEYDLMALDVDGDGAADLVNGRYLCAYDPLCNSVDIYFNNP